MKLKYLFSLLVCLCILFSTDLSGQEKSKWKDLDKSPMDMAYYPANVAWRNYLTGEDRTKSPIMKVTYSRPSMNERAIFGGLVPYGKEWRLGANEATRLTLYRDVEIGGELVARGTYSVFATPQKDHWTISISSQTSLWGSANRDQSKTVATVKVMTKVVESSREQLAMTFQRVDDEAANLVIEWEKTRVSIPIGLNPVNFENMDKSPMDQVHYPNTSGHHNYLKADELAKADPKIRVTYSRPQKKDRKIFGELLKYGEIWRVGANQSTEVSFFQAVKIGDLSLRAGTYNMYAVVNKDSWDIIFNTDRPAWGAANRDESKDVGKVTVPVTTGKEDLEALGIIFEEKSVDMVDMIIGWEKTRAKVSISFAK